MEKRKPHYDLASIKARFCTVEALRMITTDAEGYLVISLKEK